MKNTKDDLTLRFVKFINFILVAGAYIACWYGYYADHLLSPFYRKGNWAMVALFTVMYLFLSRVYEAYLITTNRISETIYSQFLSFFIADGVMFVITWLINKVFPNIVPLLITIAAQTAIAVMWAYLSHIWYFKTHEPMRTIVVYEERQELEQLIYEYGYDKKFNVVKMMSVEECIENLDTLTEAKNVFLSDVHSHERNTILKFCVQCGITVYLLPRIGDVIMSGAKSMHLFHMPMLRVGRYNPMPEYTLLKYALDRLFALVALLLTSPLMLGIAIAIKLDDGGPVFYKQRRLTKNGKVFEVIKFRSMIVNAEKDGVARLSTGDNDERITRVGAVIRRLRLDELPQFINILKGEMSFVGPRPERPEIAAQYEELIPEFSLRLQVKAGLTGYAQVYGKYNTTPYHKLEMDLLYIAHPSILEDLRILLATLKILFVPESTEGISEGVTALNEEVIDDVVEMIEH